MIHRGNGVYGNGKPQRPPKNHLLSQTGAHRSWIAMLQRCYNKNAENYPRYGGAGVNVCQAWHLFGNFFADMGERPEGHTLDRIDSRGGYSKENCRWTTPKEQERNKAGTLRLTLDGVTKPLAEWAEIAGLPYMTLYDRVKRGRVSPDRLLAPARPHK